MQIDIDFSARHVFVFGGTTGINFGIAQAFARRGARVSVASRKPGPIDSTEGFRKLIARSDAELAAAKAAVPPRCFGTTDDIANLALFLASPYASYVSGAVIACDGGGALDSVKPALERAGEQAPARP